MSFASRRSQSAAIQANGSRAMSLMTPRATGDLTSKDDPLQPLRAMADRVGKEVEQFAERVDHWHTHGNEDKKAKYQTTLRMVGKFRDLADSTIKELKKQSDAENKGELNKSVRRRIKTLAELPNMRPGDDLGMPFQSVVPSIESRSTPEASNVRELRQWQAELATWDLVRIIIEQYHPEPGTNVVAEKQARLAQVGGAKRYCPNSEIWNRFLLEDDQAKEKVVVLRWLQQTAERSESAVESITEQLKALSGKDTNTWTSGWLDTKSRIKQEKRLQALEDPLDPAVGLMSSDRSTKLVTQLDPDVPTRQSRDLEKADEYYERALWMVCYEMMRRGVPWEDIADWCKERNETWRGVSIGAAYESHPDGGPNLAGPTVGYLFRRACFYAARGARTPYEGAVYGLLSGHLARVETVCRTWDDHLYARYNSLLLSRFDVYLQKADTPRVSHQLAQKFIFQDEVAKMGDWESSTRHVVNILKQQEATAAESLSPMKLIQGSLISRDVGKLVFKVGVAIAILFQEDDRPVNLIIDPESHPHTPGPKTPNAQRTITAEAYYQSLAADPDALRILVHIFITFRMGLGLLSTQRYDQWAAMDNVIVAYIEFLRISKRISLIPLYAAQLSGDRGVHCLARILPGIKNDEEQKNYITLMGSYRIDVISVIAENCSLAIRGTGLDPSGAKHISKIELLEPTNESDYLWPGQRIHGEFPGLEINPKEEAMIESLQWWNHLDKESAQTFVDLQESLEYFLLNGRIGAAEKLIDEMSVESLSLSRTEALCGYPFDFTQPGTEEQDDIQVAQASRKTVPSRTSLRLSNIPSAYEHTQHVLNLRQLSSTYYELQQLVRLIVLFREWREEEDNMINLRDQKAKISPKRIKEVFEAIQATIGPLLESFIEPTQEADLWKIRKAYFPEVIIAYISVTQAAAFFVHRDHAAKAMDIATIVADEDKEWLQRLFLETGRMSELVDTLAQVGRAMVRIGDLGDAKKIPTKKRGNRGETLRIWDLNTRN
ncbi:nuclear pore complex protein-like protein Nup107 [Melanomma pulvis-pyrius CBS 109.77]|uniref:Nuclear pore complex protein n=1 Tax=Melanomma pulvis-pyrius CBS 109.77 TaxID=1314802 RepID=A0A6A6XVJ3_9PLEO|nr:nuclear pore complex protein-like protein Nup107 [Melanomma pulvis-pyrius CBS 109.77]